MTKQPRHLRAVEAIDKGIAESEQISIEDGIRDAISAGRMSPEEGQACIEAYRATRIGATVIELHPDFPDGAA